MRRVAAHDEDDRWRMVKEIRKFLEQGNVDVSEIYLIIPSSGLQKTNSTNQSKKHIKLVKMNSGRSRSPSSETSMLESSQCCV